MEAKEIIGLDIGQKHTGIARATNIAKLAQPLKTVPTDELIEVLKKMPAGRLEAVAVGLPRNLSGEDTKQTKWVRNWVEQAKTELDSPMFWIDEALTSQSTADGDHAKAATLLLQDFLNLPVGDRTPC